MKIILVLLDGLGDRSYRVLNNRTPLEAASTPNLDQLASMGSNGLFHASFPGQCLPSELAHYLLFGYDLKDFPGRGLLEAVGDDVPFEDNDVLCLAHFSTVSWIEGVPILTHGRKDLEGDMPEDEDLFDLISGYEAHGISFRLHRTGRNNAILVMSGDASPYVSDSDPMIPGRPMALIQALDDNPEREKAERTAMAMNEYLSYCHRSLTRKRLKPNLLATQRTGRRIRNEPFAERWGLKGMLIASGSVYMGLAYELGFTSRRVKDSDAPGRDLRERIDIALEDTDHDFIHVHTKVPDEAAHTGDPQKKAEVITALDQGLDRLLKALEKRDDLLAVFTADHSTPSISPLIHSGEPVPLCLVGPNVRCDTVTLFNEISAAKGCLGLIRGRELMCMILNYIDRSMLLGHQLGDVRRPYFPTLYEPFKLVD